MPQQEILTDEEKPHFLEPLIVLARRKFFILWFVLGAALVSAVVSLRLPVYFTATTKILPPQQNQSMSAAMLSQLGQLGPLLGAAGKDFGIRNPNDLYVAMLRSRTVADILIGRFHLMSVYRAKTLMDARKELENATEIVAGKDGIISLSVED